MTTTRVSQNPSKRNPPTSRRPQNNPVIQRRRQLVFGQTSHHPGGTPIDKVLVRLTGVRRCGSGWIARCPAHEDRTPSLTLRETADGTALLHCFGGCDPADVVAAIGLTLSDLFPGRRSPRSCIAPGVSFADLRHALEVERLVVLIVQSDLERGRAVRPEDLERAELARRRIRAARALA